MISRLNVRLNVLLKFDCVDKCSSPSFMKFIYWTVGRKHQRGGGVFY